MKSHVVVFWVITKRNPFIKKNCNFCSLRLTNHVLQVYNMISTFIALKISTSESKIYTSLSQDDKIKNTLYFKNNSTEI
jgi:hypothetical protein